MWLDALKKKGAFAYIEALQHTSYTWTTYQELAVREGSGEVKWCWLLNSLVDIKRVSIRGNSLALCTSCDKPPQVSGQLHVHFKSLYHPTIVCLNFILDYQASGLHQPASPAFFCLVHIYRSQSRMASVNAPKLIRAIYLQRLCCPHSGWAYIYYAEPCPLFKHDWQLTLHALLG